MYETSSFEADKSANEYNKKISDLEWSQSKHQQLNISETWNIDL